MQNNCIGRSYSWKCRISAVEAGSVQADGKNNGVRAFALEGDYGGCEQVNRYIHGGEGTAQEAAAAIGFPFIERKRWQNLSPICASTMKVHWKAKTFALRFDMQRLSYSMRF